MSIKTHDTANGIASDPNIEFADGPNLDAFSRQRVSSPFGLFDFKAISDRGNTIWEERITGAIIEHGTVTGTFTVGDTFSGGTSGKKGTITAVGSGNITYDTSDNDFTDGETITILTGGSPGSTAVISSHNTGADIVYNYDRSSISLNLGTVSGQKVIRQSIRYFAYTPGYSHQVITTQIFDTGKTNVTQTVMYGDDLNGIGIRLSDTTVEVFIRSSVSGSMVENVKMQSEWNDILDGSNGDRNPSGIKLDIIKTQINAIDFQWLGVGRVRLALDIDGQVVPIYEYNHANEADSVYMKTPTLPVRYEIENTGTTASATSLEQICCAVSSEGGYSLPGFEFAAGNKFSAERAVTVRTPIFAIRLKNEFPTGHPNRKTVRFLTSNLTARTNDATFEIVHVHEPFTMTATWVSTDNNSCIEYSTDISALTAKHMHIIEIINVFSGQANKGEARSLNAEFVNQHSYLSQNFESNNSQLFVIYATPRTGTADVSSSLSWIEFE